MDKQTLHHAFISICLLLQACLPPPGSNKDPFANNKTDEQQENASVTKEEQKTTSPIDNPTLNPIAPDEKAQDEGAIAQNNELGDTGTKHNKEEDSEQSLPTTFSFELTDIGRFIGKSTFTTQEEHPTLPEKHKFTFNGFDGDDFVLIHFEPFLPLDIPLELNLHDARSDATEPNLQALFLGKSWLSASGTVHIETFTANGVSGRFNANLVNRKDENDSLAIEGTFSGPWLFRCNVLNDGDSFQETVPRSTDEQGTWVNDASLSSTHCRTVRLSLPE